MRGIGVEVCQEVTRHSARLNLVRSNSLAESEQLWLPNEPLAYATHLSKVGPDSWESAFSGRSWNEIRNMLAMKMVMLLVIWLNNALAMVLLTLPLASDIRLAAFVLYHITMDPALVVIASRIERWASG
jgi:hypothetical protein